jgi:hypothetical protein
MPKGTSALHKRVRFLLLPTDEPPYALSSAITQRRVQSNTLGVIHPYTEGRMPRPVAPLSCLRPTNSEAFAVMGPSFRLQLEAHGRTITVSIPPRVLAMTQYLAEIIGPILREQLSKDMYSLVCKGFDVRWSYREKRVKYVILPHEGILAEARFRAVMNVLLEGQVVRLEPLTAAARLEAYCQRVVL